MKWLFGGSMIYAHVQCTHFSMNRRKFCCVMTKILCAVNTNFSIVSFLCSWRFFFSSSFPFIVNVNSCRRCRRMLFEKAACMLLLPAFRSIAVIRYYFMRTVPRSALSAASYACSVHGTAWVQYITRCVLPFTFFYLVRLFVLFAFACTFSPLQ